MAVVFYKNNNFEVMEAERLQEKLQVESIKKTIKTWAFQSK
ncbi:hypothetical protein [Clostridium sp. ZBS18]|nr:hypothetical protein [Clostridium sp. ZBS18]